MNPVDATTTATAGSGPALQARATYAGQGLKAWVAHKSQSFQGYSMSAAEVGASLSSGPFGLVANHQSGNAIGILSDGDQGDIKGKNTFLQATYKVADNLRLGLGVGKSANSTGASTTSFRSNQSTTAGAYFSLTPSLTLVGEVGETRSKDFGSSQAKQTSYSVGGIFFF